MAMDFVSAQTEAKHLNNGALILGGEGAKIYH